MKNEEKQLLLKDICGRLPYGVILHDEYGKKDYKLNSLDANGFINYDIANKITHIKPYLRPMSSMTDEEEIEYDATFADVIVNGHHETTMTYKSFDFLNSKHFDYRGLIPMGLALEAPRGMYS